MSAHVKNETHELDVTLSEPEEKGSVEYSENKFSDFSK